MSNKDLMYDRHESSSAGVVETWNLYSYKQFIGSAFKNQGLTSINVQSKYIGYSATTSRHINEMIREVTGDPDMTLKKLQAGKFDDSKITFMVDGGEVHYKEGKHEQTR